MIKWRGVCLYLYLLFSFYVNSEELHLNDGSILKGKIKSKTSKGINIYLEDLNQEIFIKWEYITSEDRNKFYPKKKGSPLKNNIKKNMPISSSKKFSLLFPAVKIKALELNLKNGKKIIGKILNIKKDTLTLLYKNEKITIPVEQIKSKKEKKIPAEQILTGENLYFYIIKNYPPITAEDHLKLGEYCKKNKMKDEAIYHFKIAKILGAKEDKTRYYKFKNILQNISTLIAHKNFDKAEKAIEKIMKDKDISSTRKEYLLKLKKIVDEKKQDEKIKKVYRSIVKEIKKCTFAKIKQNLSFPDLVKYIKENLKKEVFSAVSQKYHMSTKQIENIWEKRPIKFSRYVCKGKYMFLTHYNESSPENSSVSQSTQSKNSQSTSQNRSKEKEEGASQENEEKHDLTPEEVWEKTPFGKRYEIVYPEIIKVFYKVKRIINKKCNRCKGKGIVKRKIFTPTGGLKSFPVKCGVCYGIGYFEVIIYY